MGRDLSLIFKGAEKMNFIKTSLMMILFVLLSLWLFDTAWQTFIALIAPICLYFLGYYHIYKYGKRTQLELLLIATSSILIMYLTFYLWQQPLKMGVPYYKPVTGLLGENSDTVIASAVFMWNILCLIVGTIIYEIFAWLKWKKI